MPRSEKRLRHLFTQLSAADQETVLAFAEFLHSRTPSWSSAPPLPQVSPRPPDESVIAAIKRLSNSYPMLEKAKLLDETSALMSEHILQGRDKVTVIDELEAIFLRHYEEMIQQSEKSP